MNILHFDLSIRTMLIGNFPNLYCLSLIMIVLLINLNLELLTWFLYIFVLNPIVYRTLSYLSLTFQMLPLLLSFVHHYMLPSLLDIDLPVILELFHLLMNDLFLLMLSLLHIFLCRILHFDIRSLASSFSTRHNLHLSIQLPLLNNIHLKMIYHFCILQQTYLSLLLFLHILHQ